MHFAENIICLGDKNYACSGGKEKDKLKFMGVKWKPQTVGE